MPDALPTFPASRPVGYDPDLQWQPDAWAGANYTPSAWDGTYNATGGGRWNQQLIAVAKDLVYYEALT